ncbi:magnesium transporter [Amorphus coralli]|uniref:magnesium transporter n=1 Tax=Amorphus coralli TaxID=340680 RepID=UPI000366A83C|nr:magnesium transporter [Amorphus coralli]
MTHKDLATQPAADESVTVLMARDVAVLPAAATCAEAIASLAGQAGAETIYQACATDAEGRFVGLVSLRRCLAAAGGDALASVIEAPAFTLGAANEVRQSASALLEAGTEAVPVLASDGSVAGLLTIERARRFLLEEMEETSEHFAGIVGEVADDYLDHTVWSDYLRRVPWILGLAVAGLAAGYVVHVYEDALDALVILALYMPMVADTGGNVGTQSASLVTRAISVGDITMRDSARILWRETRVSLMMAATLFTFAFLKVYLISNSADVPLGLSISDIGFAIALALAAQVVSATLVGALLPLVAVAARQDPAVISGPALTTIVDLSGLILYFTITAYMLGLPMPTW